MDFQNITKTLNLYIEMNTDLIDMVYQLIKKAYSDDEITQGAVKNAFNNDLNSYLVDKGLGICMLDSAAERAEFYNKTHKKEAQEKED